MMALGKKLATLVAAAAAFTALMSDAPPAEAGRCGAHRVAVVGEHPNPPLGAAPARASPSLSHHDGDEQSDAASGAGELDVPASCSRA